MSISVDMARRVLEACKQRARELHSPVSIAIVDAGGHLVLFERMMSPYGWATGNISIAKANTAVMFNQSTDAVAQWASGIPGFASSLATMTEGKFIMAAGGWPIRVHGATIGGIGVSGGNAPGRDDEIARAGLVVLDAPPAYAPPVQQPSYSGFPPQQVPYNNAPNPVPQPAYYPPREGDYGEQRDFKETPNAYEAREGKERGDFASTRHLAPDQDEYGAETFNDQNADSPGGRT